MAARADEILHLTHVDEEKLNPGVKLFLQQLNALPVTDPKTVAVETRRRLFQSLSGTHGGELVSLPLIRDVNIELEGRCLTLRIYYPVDIITTGTPASPIPAYLYLHGGGWHAGSLTTHEHVMRRLTKASGCIIAALEYRLAPENAAPAGLHDAVDTFRWLLENGPRYGIDTSLLGIAGDSAGANIAVAAVLELSPSVSPACQFLIYPSLDLSSPLLSSPPLSGEALSSPLPSSTLPPGHSLSLFPAGFYLRVDAIRHFIHLYTAESGLPLTDPKLSPLLASDEALKGCPRTHVVTAGFDPLLSDGEAFIEKLRKLGIEARYSCYTGLIHAFMHLIATVAEIPETLNEIGEAMRRLLLST